VQRASGIPCALFTFERREDYLQTSGDQRRELLIHACFALTLNQEVRRYGARAWALD
jgi:hypothetical protein